MGDDSPSDAVAFRDAVGHAARFTYRHSLSLVAVSLAWFLAVLPIITIGPATLGAYRAVIDIRNRGSVDTRGVFDTVRGQLTHAVLLGVLPVAFWGIALFYAIQYSLFGETVTLVLFLAAFYIGVYLALLSVPTFVALAHGRPGYDAISFGRSWLGSHTTLALMMVVVTALFAATTLFLTIAFPLLFAGTVAGFHVEIVNGGAAESAVDNANSVDGSDSGSIA